MIIITWQVLIKKWATQVMVAFLVCQVLPTSLRAESPIEVGYVEAFDGLSEDYEIRRGDEELPIAFYMPVFQNDQLTIKRERRHVILRIGAAATHVVTVTQRESPYIIRFTQEPRSPIANLITLIGEEITGQHDLIVHEGVVMGGPEALELVIRGLADSRAQVASGQRKFGLEWSGGRPDYQLHLTRSANGDLLLAQQTSRMGLVADHDLDLSEGAYEIVLKDADGEIASGGFHAVAPEALPLPVPPEALLSVNYPPAMAATLQASWLANQGNGCWAFEAYLRCLPWVDQHQPAKALAELLVRGWLPERM